MRYDGENRNPFVRFGAPWERSYAEASLAGLVSLSFAKTSICLFFFMHCIDSHVDFVKSLGPLIFGLRRLALLLE